jgi:peroxiredoxin Q/BCP
VFLGNRADRDMAVEGSVQGKVKVGDSAPDFALPNQSGETLRLRDLVGKKIIVLYFYPKDFTLGCTAEACAFRDNYEVFKEAGAEVVGVSSQSVDSHKRFALANQLPFILLSDEDSKVRKLYGASSAFGLMPGRVTYVIDKKGIVRHIFSSQLNPTKHIEEALRIIREISKD